MCATLRRKHEVYKVVKHYRYHMCSGGFFSFFNMCIISRRPAKFPSVELTPTGFIYVQLDTNEHCESASVDIMELKPGKVYLRYSRRYFAAVENKNDGLCEITSCV